jgi:hypothetical protein
MAEKDTVQAHEWLLEAAEGETQRIVEGTTEFTLSADYPTPSFSRVLSLKDQIEGWRKHDFGGVEITSVDLKAPSNGDLCTYGNYGEPKGEKLWEPNSNASTSLIIKAEIPGKLDLAGLGDTLRLGFSGAIKKALAKRLEQAFPLPVELMLLPYTIDALFIGKPAELNRYSGVRFEKDYVVAHSLTKIDPNLLQLGYLVHTQQAFMVFTAVWKEAVSNASREMLAQRLQNDLRDKSLEVHFLVW